jgi:hypothetical protein
MERERMDLLAVVSCLLEDVDAVFASFFRLLLRVLDHSGRIELDVGG